jgi:CRP/FNR family transcriptional regulator
MMDVMSPQRRADTPPSVTFDEVVAQVPFLRALTDAERERLRPYAEIRRVGAGQSIWTFDDSLNFYIFLVEGHVKMVRPCDSGREVIVDVSGPSELLCAGPVSSFSPACCTCVAFDDGVIAVFLPRRDVLQMIERNAPAGAAFIRESTGRDMRLCQRISELASGHVEQRVAALLLRLADQNGSSREQGHVKIPLHLSRQDIADLCGTTLESAIRTMSKFSRESIVTTVARGFVINSRPDLERLSRGVPRRSHGAGGQRPS